MWWGLYLIWVIGAGSVFILLYDYREPDCRKCWFALIISSVLWPLSAIWALVECIKERKA